MDKGKEKMDAEEIAHERRADNLRIPSFEGLQGLRPQPSSEHNGMYPTTMYDPMTVNGMDGMQARLNGIDVPSTKEIWNVYSRTPLTTTPRPISTSPSGSMLQKARQRVNASTSSEQGSIDDDELLTSLGKNFNMLFEDMPSVSLDSSIYRVPERVKSVRREAYTPMIVSIGPFHQGKEETRQAMDDYKLGILNGLVKRDPKKLEDLLKVVMESEVQARSCYAEIISMKREELIPLMLLDGCFIVKLFCDYENYEKQRGEYHEIFSNHWRSNAVYRDLLLLENQLPFFLLEKLFTVINGFDHRRRRSNLSFLELTKIFLVSYATIRDYIPDVPKTGEHLVDLMLNNICHPFNVTILHQMGTEPVFIPSATDLRDRGIILRMGSSAKFILEVDFTDGVLSIPPLHVDGRTESVFRNLLAMEQSHCGKTQASSGNVTIFSDYVTLLDCLINTPADVALLRERNIIHNGLGDNKEVAQLFNNLRNGVDRSLNEFFYYQLFVDVNSHIRNKWPTWNAKLKKEYLSTPWKILSVTAAIILIACAIIQTAASVKQANW